MKNKGISLIILIITIIVIIILAGTVILTLTSNNIIGSANEAIFKQNVSEYRSQVDLHYLSFLEKEVATYYPPKTDENIENITKVVTSITNNDSKKFAIYNKELVYTGNDINEKKWAEQVGIFSFGEFIPIYSKEQLYKINDNLSGHYILICDIDLKGSATEQFKPLCVKNPFSGIFDGNGYTIGGIYIDDMNTDSIALFSSNIGTVKNLTVKNSKITGKIYVSSIVAYNKENGIVENCISYADISGTSIIGGVVAFNDGTVRNCVNNGSIKSIEGSFYGAGGIAGRNHRLIENCHNNGNVNGNTQVGGIVGNCDSTPNVKVVQCSNKGNVTGNNTVGGIVGGMWQTNGATTLVKVESCYNEGEIYSIDSRAGGIAGYNNGIISFSYNKGKVTAKNTAAGGIAGQIRNPNILGDNPVGKIFNSYNIGPVEGKLNIGGIVGQIVIATGDFEVEIKNCYYLSGSLAGYNGQGNIDKVEAKLDNEFKSQNMITLLGSQYFKIDQKLNNGYPTLIWQK